MSRLQGTSYSQPTCYHCGEWVSFGELTTTIEMGSCMSVKSAHYSHMMRHTHPYCDEFIECNPKDYGSDTEQRDCVNCKYWARTPGNNNVGNCKRTEGVFITSGGSCCTYWEAQMQECKTCKHWLSADCVAGTCDLLLDIITTTYNSTCSDWEDREIPG